MHEKMDPKLLCLLCETRNICCRLKHEKSRYNKKKVRSVVRGCWPDRFVRNCRCATLKHYQWWHLGASQMSLIAFGTLPNAVNNIVWAHLWNAISDSICAGNWYFIDLMPQVYFLLFKCCRKKSAKWDYYKRLQNQLNITDETTTTIKP